jgi:hypothetical protein
MYEVNTVVVPEHFLAEGKHSFIFIQPGDQNTLI